MSRVTSKNEKFTDGYCTRSKMRDTSNSTSKSKKRTTPMNKDKSPRAFIDQSDKVVKNITNSP
jgi:hypothetical protein